MTSKRSERERLEAREWLDPISISFGDVFLSSHDGTSRYLIVDVGKKRIFGSVQIVDDSSVEWIPTLAGTSDRKSIETMVDHWDMDRIVGAVMRGLGDYQPIPSGFLENLKKNSLKKPRVLSP